jgi:peptide deformylase
VSVRAVRIYGDPVLRQRTAEVTSFDDSLRSLAADMRETMHAYRGVGLAANQIGVLQRICVVDVPDEQEGAPRHVYTLVNPRVAERNGSEPGEEGCLSIPGIYEEVSRALHIEVEYRDERGEKRSLDAEGFLARAIQHEIDHLDGVLFVDRLSLLKRQFLRRSLEALARGEMPADYRSPAGPGGAR